MNMKSVAVTGSFDNVQARDLRLLEEASQLGAVSVLLRSDDSIEAITGQPPRFPVAERFYLVSSVRYVEHVVVVDGPALDDRLAASEAIRPDIWVIDEVAWTKSKADYCKANGIELRSISGTALERFPTPASRPISTKTAAGREIRRKRVLVTGCFDWLHSGHVRFFEEVSELGDLYAVVGHDANIRFLKGEGHPLLNQDERRYAVGAIRFVTQALISSGEGWMDAEPEISVIEPDIYAVNEDGDRPEKREFCRSHGIEYVVLRRLPKAGLPARSSTDLRGF